MIFGLVGLVLGIATIVLLVYHWDIIDKAFVNIITKLGGI